MSQGSTFITHLVREEGKRKMERGSPLGSGCDSPEAGLFLLTLLPPFRPAELWQLAAKRGDPVGRPAVNEGSVWDQSTRWMLFRFGSMHRKHSAATQLQVAYWPSLGSWASLQRPINMDINKEGWGMEGGGYGPVPL